MKGEATSFNVAMPRWAMVRFKVEIPPITATTASATVQPMRAYSAAWPIRPLHCWKVVVMKPVISIYELTFAVMREVIMGLHRELNNGTEVIRSEER